MHAEYESEYFTAALNDIFFLTLTSLNHTFVTTCDSVFTFCSVWSSLTVFKFLSLKQHHHAAFVTSLHPRSQGQVSQDVMDMDVGVRESVLAEADVASVFHRILEEQHEGLDLGMTPQQGKDRRQRGSGHLTGFSKLH